MFGYKFLFLNLFLKMFIFH